MAREWEIPCKINGCPNMVQYSDMMYQKMHESGESRPLYCEKHQRMLLMERTTMGAAYFDVEPLPDVDLSTPIPGELGMVHHPERVHTMTERTAGFDPNIFGAKPDKIVEIYEHLKDPDHQVAIVIGETGSGKSTALPYWLIFPPDPIPSDFFIRDGQILITQPRIVATEGIAEYLGTLLGSSVGKGFDIGYRHSKDRNTNRFNAAFLATDGTLINMIKNGQLADLSVIMIDEAHERSLNIDVILRLLRDQLPLYPHLKLLVVSATINEKQFLDFFGEATAKVIKFDPKRKFDIAVEYASAEEKLPYENPNQLRRELVPAMVRKIMWLLNEQVQDPEKIGHILAFLHGVKPIDETVNLVRNAVENNPNLKDKVEVFPLYSDLDKQHKDWALNGKDQNKIRVVISTNVAEASITVEGVVYVIDSGVENQANWSVDKKEQRVELEVISQANARQRHGRSGRTRPGVAFCLYSEEQYRAMPEYPTPAIQRSSMDDIILMMKEMGIDDLDDGWIDTPLTEELTRSYASLQGGGAIDDNGLLTEYGALIREFSYPVELTNLILQADRYGCAVEMATILPIIRNGGHRQLLLWDGNWDQATKDNVKDIQRLLSAGCRDDIDFVYRIYSLWSDPPVEFRTDEKGQRRSKAESRKAWVKTYFVNDTLLGEEITEERNNILRILSAHKKNSNIRLLEASLLERVRLILATCISPIPLKGIYEYSNRMEGDVNSMAKYVLDMSDDWLETVDWLKTASPMATANAVARIESLAQSEDEIKNRLLNLERPAVWVDPVKETNEEWLKKVQSLYPIGTLVNTLVDKLIPIGIKVVIEGGVVGFARLDTTNLQIGDQLIAKVRGYDELRRNLVLNFSIPENNPLARYSVGQTLRGYVKNVNEKLGAFISLDFGFDGMIHLSKMGKYSLTDLSVGHPLVEVEVIGLKEKEGKILTSLRLISVL